MNRKISFLGLFFLFVIVLTHFILWVHITEPLPAKSGMTNFYNPVSGYFKVAQIIGNEPDFLKNLLFTDEPSQGLLFIGSFLFYLGLGNFLLSAPYLMNILCIISLVLCSCFLRGNATERFLNGLIICFFPLAQICIKQFCLTGLAVSYILVALLFFRSWILCKRKGLLWGFLLFAWFALALHSVVFSLLLCFMAVYLFWSIRNHCFERWFLSAILFSVLPALFFYDVKMLSDNSFFFRIILGRTASGSESLLWWAFLFVFLPVIVGLYLRKKEVNSCSEQTYCVFSGRMPKIFRNGLNLLLITVLFFHFIGVNFLSVETVFFYGLCIFGWCLSFKSFNGIRGFIYLYILVSFFYLLLFYYAFCSYTSFSLLFLPLFLILIQTLSENKSLLLRLFLLTLFLLVSDFFPDYAKVSSTPGVIVGKGIYTNIFGSPLYNPLGWHNYGFGAFFREFTKKISEHNFSREPLFLVAENDFVLSPYFCAVSDLVNDIPELVLLERAGNFSDRYQEYQKDKESFFEELLLNGDIPILLYMDVAKPDDGSYNQKNTEEVFSGLNHDLLAYFRDSNYLNTDYDCYMIPEKRPIAKVCFDKKLSTDSSFSHKKRLLLKERWGLFLLYKAEFYYAKGDMRRALGSLFKFDELNIESEEIRKRRLNLM